MSHSEESLVRSYLTLRKSIGVIGIALPFALAAGAAILERSVLQPSISHYYHTIVGDVFVGSLCAIAVFLFSYCGHGRRDRVATNLASVFAVGVALFPTAETENTSGPEAWIGTIHFLFAAALFLTLSYISLKLFRLTNKVNPTQEKLARNRVYTTCAYIMLACIGLIAVIKLFFSIPSVLSLRPIFWLEAAAIIAFGVSWLTKGEAILRDRQPHHDAALSDPHIPKPEEARTVGA